MIDHFVTLDPMFIEFLSDDESNVVPLRLCLDSQFHLEFQRHEQSCSQRGRSHSGRI